VESEKLTSQKVKCNIYDAPLSSFFSSKQPTVK